MDNKQTQNNFGLSVIGKIFLMSLVISVLIFSQITCGGSSSSSSNGGNSAPAIEPDADQTARFRITNNCESTIWIQQDNMPDGTDQVTELASGAHTDYEIPDEGLASTRFWPKMGCDSDGQKCTLGQSSSPCSSTAGCAPPVDSKIEVTWGCTLTDTSGCAITPQGDRIGDTFYNASAVDGYTLPFKVAVESSGGSDCVDLDCSGLSISSCPTDENLSQGRTSTHSEYASESLLVVDPDDTSASSGCFSPCKKLDYPGWGGVGLQDETGDEESMYCCPTPPIEAAECSAGPVASSQYVQAIHAACFGGVYGYAYDDGVGLHNCDPGIKIQMIFGPNCP